MVATEPTHDRLRAVLDAASALLGARQDEMCTIDEWAALARAVADCTGRAPRDLLTERDIEDAATYGADLGTGKEG